MADDALTATAQLLLLRQQSVDVLVRHFGALSDVEVVESLPISFSFREYRGPTEAGLLPFQTQFFEQRYISAFFPTPLVPHVALILHVPCPSKHAEPRSIFSGG